MLTFFLFGKYSESSIKEISDKRTRYVGTLVKKLGGKLISIYALLGQFDLVIIVEMPGLEKAAELSASLYRETGISFSTHPAIQIESFDRMADKSRS